VREEMRDLALHIYSSSAAHLITTRFDAKFSTDNRISTLTAAPVKILSSTPGQPDRISESHDLLTNVRQWKNQALDHAIQTGNVQIVEANAVPVPIVPRSAK